MGVIFTHHLTHAVCSLAVRVIGSITHFVHAEQNAAMNRFESVTDIGQCARHYDRHRIVDIGRLHFIFNIDL